MYITDIVDAVPCFPVACSVDTVFEYIHAVQGFLVHTSLAYNSMESRLCSRSYSSYLSRLACMDSGLVRALRVFPAGPGSRSNLSGSPRLAWSLCSRSSELSCLRCRLLSH